jgi:hypothetical protein
LGPAGAALAAGAGETPVNAQHVIALKRVKEALRLACSGQALWRHVVESADSLLFSG